MDKLALCKLNFQLDYSNLLSPYINKQCTTNEDFFTTSISPFLRKRLVEWLFSGRGWYKGANITPSNIDMFRRKALCILNEYYLAYRSQEVKIQTHDIFFRLNLLYKIDRLFVWLGEVRSKEIDENFNSI